MMHSFSEILAEAQKEKRRIMVTPNPQSKRVLTAVNDARASGLIAPVLVGNWNLIEKSLSALGLNTEGCRIIDKHDPLQALKKSIEIIDRGEADIIFQGDVNIREFLNAVTDEKIGIVEAGDLSYASLFELPSENRVSFFTDTCIQEFPDLKQKINILTNAISLANVIGIEKPKIAALSLVEMINLNAQSSLDAAILSKMSERGQLDAIIDGPLDVDCASSFERARRKGLNSPVSGKVDIYLLHDIESGFSTVEVFTFLGGARTAGALMGSKIPVILNLRFEPTDSILVDIALANLRIQGRTLL
jgi:phosphate butyryltransferase